MVMASTAAARSGFVDRLAVVVVDLLVGLRGDVEHLGNALVLDFGPPHELFQRLRVGVEVGDRVVRGGQRIRWRHRILGWVVPALPLHLGGLAAQGTGFYPLDRHRLSPPAPSGSGFPHGG